MMKQEVSLKKIKKSLTNNTPNTKWFLNLASKKMTNDSTSSKLKKNGISYETKEELQSDIHKHYEDIFKKKERNSENTIENFLGNIGAR
jgi:thymidylate kinase